MTRKPIKVHLSTGDKVTVGRLPTGRDLFAALKDPRSQESDTVLSLYLLRASITGFGPLPLPVSISTLLSLPLDDVEDIQSAYRDFLSGWTNRKEVGLMWPDNARLMVGYKHAGVSYTEVEFYPIGDPAPIGSLAFLHDPALEPSIEALGRVITRLKSADGKHAIDGPLSLSVFERMAADDILGLMLAFGHRYKRLDPSLLEMADTFISQLNRSANSGNN